MIKKLLVLFLGAATLLALAGCEGGSLDATDGNTDGTAGGGAAKEVKTYRIGVIGPMTGDAAAYGVEMQRAMNYRLAEINKTYADKGVKFELVYEDGKCEGGAATVAFQKLTDIDGIKLIIGGLCSSESLGIAPLLKGNGALAMSFGSSNPDLEGVSNNFFTLSYSDSLVSQGIAKELGKYQKVAMISEQNDYNEGIRKNVKKWLAEKYPKVEIEIDEVFPKGTTDMRNILAKIAASDADAVLLNPNAGVTATSLIKQLAEIKDWDKPLVGQYVLMGQDTLEVAPNLLEGLVIFDAPGIQSQKFEEYKQKIASANGSLDNLGNYYTASTLDSLDLLTEMAVKYDGDASGIISALSTGTFSGWISPEFSFKGKSFVQGIDVARYVVHDGKSVLQN